MKRNRLKNKYYIGLTGGIASGKTVAAERFRALGATVIDADGISRRALEEGGKCVETVKETFGKSILNDAGAIDRRALALLVFSDEEQRKKLNAIVHPEVLREMRRLARKAAGRMVVFDVPLLFESGFSEETDTNIVVAADDDIRIRRMTKDRGMTEEEAQKRIASQMPQETQCAMADHVIWNNGDIDELYKSVDRIYEMLVTERSA